MPCLKNKLLFAAGLLCLSPTAAYEVSQAQTLTYADLANRTIDLQYLATLPELGVTSHEFSSYSRMRNYDSVTDQYKEWFYNADCCGNMGGTLLAQMNTPGVIWRAWSATPGSGLIPVVLNGASTPAINLPFQKWFDLSTAPFTYAGLTNGAQADCYIPIPYSSSCKINGNSGFGNYFQFNYSSFPATATLPTFQNGSTEEKNALQTVNTWLTTKLGTDPAGVRAGEATDVKTVRIGSGIGAVSTVIRLKGTQAITAIKVRASDATTGNKTIDRVKLRELSMRIYWDNDVTPSVWAPLGDFFGTGFGYNQYKSVPMGMTATEFYSYWYMPFKDSARIQLLNDGNTGDTVQFTIVHSAVNNIANLTRFHAKFHRDTLEPTRADRNYSLGYPEYPNECWMDWTICKVTGRGRFVGTMLCEWNPLGGWWGEGNEKFFIDGEKWPSWMGTGSEDYIGYAWSSPALFTHPYQNQPMCENNLICTQNRFHISDQVPFQTSFEGCIEKYFCNSRPEYHAATAYFYLAPGGVDPYTAMSDTARIRYWNSTYTAPGPTTWVDPYANEVGTAVAPARQITFIERLEINQNSGAKTLTVNTMPRVPGRVELIDLRGIRRISATTDEEGTSIINTRSLSEGAYVLRMTTEQRCIVKSVTIAH